MSKMSKQDMYLTIILRLGSPYDATGTSFGHWYASAIALWREMGGQVAAGMYFHNRDYMEFLDFIREFKEQSAKSPARKEDNQP